MRTWPNRRLLDLLGIQVPILQAPMAGANDAKLAIAVGLAGGLGALPCAMLSGEALSEQVAAFRAACSGPLNLNFFCHHSPEPDPAQERRWRAALAPFYAELGLDSSAAATGASRQPFDAAACAQVEALLPEVVSFHFGLPSPALLARVKATGAKVLSSATTVREAQWLAHQGCDAIIAMGLEAGGHRGSFLDTALERQLGTFALVPQIADAIEVPVIAAGGIADGRGLAAALMLGAAGVQVGTAFLFTPEATVGPLHRQALATANGSNTAVTNLFTGRPARGIVNRLMQELGPMSSAPPAFPLAGGALAPLRAAHEAMGSSDFTNLWSGQNLTVGKRDLGASELTRRLAADALQCLSFE